ncbi:MAG: HAD superfamily hydrolase (TIGR01484 family) [Gammaproteobacteria bacterium]|jgi:HAD superfamily hydrolase (TIGR01484 family)
MSGLVATDLDGTLMSSRRTVSSTDLQTLHDLGAAGVTRVVATGRSLYSARLALPPDFPIDYLVFSTGAGVMDWSTQKLLRHNALSQGELACAVNAVESLGLDFMAHWEVPDNHRFVYRRGSSDARGDFEQRLTRYREYAQEWEAGAPAPERVSQLVAIAHATRAELFDVLTDDLPHLQVVRATSPLDGQSWWLEIFPPGVSKSHACAWLFERNKLHGQRTLAIGNDYNDEDMLAWAESAFVVANAPAVLREKHLSVPSNDHSGFSVAVAKWTAEA